MRKLKFRAWDKKRKYLYESVISMDLHSTGVIVVGGKDIEDDSEILVADVILMQYTGFKDKNGLTEIYEGDIVRNERHSFVTDVQFYGGAFRCKSKGLPLSVYIDDCYEDVETRNQLEVVGNVYEHPKLLKKKPNTVQVHDEEDWNKTKLINF